MEETIERLHPARIDGPVGFVVREPIKTTIQTAWATITQPGHLEKFFGMIPERPLDNLGVTVVRWTSGTPDELDVTEVDHMKRIVFEWNAYKQPYRTICTFEIEDYEGGVKVSVGEKGWALTLDGVESSLADCQGWTEFTQKMKMYLEHGIS